MQRNRFSSGVACCASPPVLPARQTLERKNRMTDGRLAVARMIGYGEKARDAQLALIEIAASICRPRTDMSQLSAYQGMRQQDGDQDARKHEEPQVPLREPDQGTW